LFVNYGVNDFFNNEIVKFKKRNNL
jgi:hypothetical protein